MTEAFSLDGSTNLNKLEAFILSVDSSTILNKMLAFVLSVEGSTNLNKLAFCLGKCRTDVEAELLVHAHT